MSGAASVTVSVLQPAHGERQESQESPYVKGILHGAGCTAASTLTHEASVMRCSAYPACTCQDLTFDTVALLCSSDSHCVICRPANAEDKG